MPTMDLETTETPPADTTGMDDAAFLDYCETHVSQPNAGFTVPQTIRLLLLAGMNESARPFRSMIPTTVLVHIPKAVVEIVETARRRVVLADIGKAQGEA